VRANTEFITNIGTEENWINVYFTNRDRLPLPLTLTYIFTLLPQEHFRKWHKSHIFNLREIDYYRYDGRAIVLEMTDGELSRISKGNTHKFIPLIGEYDNIKWK
jgi:DNA-binding LytR/AlgR family response regulator